jgi:hypothetical protein
MAPSFLDLPTELRLEIYQYIFAAKDELHNPWLSLLFTNKQLNAEVSDILKDATLRLRITPRLFHLTLAQNLRLHDLGHANTELDPFIRIKSFQDYCKRFFRVIFDVTETRLPTDCRLPPSYERKAKELADSLTARLTATTSEANNNLQIEIRWGSFSRNVYKGIVT